jgi:hypothetical protein
MPPWRVNFNDPHHPWDSNAVSPPYDRARIPAPKYLPDLAGVREDLGRYYVRRGCIGAAVVE